MGRRRSVAFESGIDQKVENLLDAADRELDVIESSYEGNPAEADQAIQRLRAEVLIVRRAFLAEQTARAEQ